MRRSDSHRGSVSMWIAGLKQGDPEAAELIWQRYFRQLADLARLKLGENRRVADEDDVLVSVFDTLWRGACKGRFPLLKDRTDLWSLLIAIMRQKVIDQRRKEMTQKRGSGKIRGGSALAGRQAHAELQTIDDLASNSPTPEELVCLQEEYEKGMKSLVDPALRRIAQMKLEGYSNKEIAAKMDVSVRTIERKLNRIQEMWLTAVE